MEKAIKNESGPGKEDQIKPIKVSDTVTYLAEHLDAQQEIFGGVFKEKEEISAKMNAEIVLKVIEKMGLRALTVEEVKEIQKQKVPDKGPSYLFWDPEENKFKIYDPEKSWRQLKNPQGLKG